MPSASTFFIPDISGFTQFIRQTEREHSRHIITELIQLIIDEGSPSFRVAEVEGDAVFFFRENEVLSTDRIFDVARRIYGRFHGHLQHYEHRRICSCGACRTAVQLRLKFVVHCGEMDLIDIHGSKKPFGEPVIVVHRLLKNTIEEDEYVLFSRNYPKQEPIAFDGLGVHTEGSIGEVAYDYKLIQDWEIRDSPPLSVVTSDSDIECENVRVLEAPSDELHEMILNLRYRHLWVPEADQIEFDDQRLNQAGLDHLCIIKGRELHFTAIRPSGFPEGHAYGEIVRQPAPFKYMEMNFYLEPLSEMNSRVTVRLKADLPWYMQLLRPVFCFFLRKRLLKILDNMDQGFARYRDLVLSNYES